MTISEHISLVSFIVTSGNNSLAQDIITDGITSKNGRNIYDSLWKVFYSNQNLRKIYKFSFISAWKSFPGNQMQLWYLS